MVPSFEQDLLKIIEIVKANYDGHPWHGVTTETVLIRNSRNILDKPHFIRRNLWLTLGELIEWKKLLVRYLEGETINFNRAAAEMKIDVPDSIGDDEWAELIINFKKAHFSLIGELKKVLAMDMGERLFPNHLSFSQIAYGIIHSELFCMGQLNILAEFTDSCMEEKPRVVLKKQLTPAIRSLRR